MKFIAREVAELAGVGIERVRDWIEAGHLLPLNPNRPRIPGKDPWMFNRRAAFAARMGAIALQAGLGPQTSNKLVRYLSRPGWEDRAEKGMGTAYANRGSLQVGHKDSKLISAGPFSVVVFDLAGLWARANREFDALEKGWRPEPPTGGRPRQLLVEALNQQAQAEALSHE